VPRWGEGQEGSRDLLRGSDDCRGGQAEGERERSGQVVKMENVGFVHGLLKKSFKEGGKPLVGKER